MLLKPDAYLEGSVSATQYVRPLKFAFLIPDQDLAIAVKVIEWCCLMWGGRHQLLVPYSPRHGMTRDWQKILRSYDPDIVLDCAGMTSDDETLFRHRGWSIDQWSGAEISDFPVRRVRIPAAIQLLEQTDEHGIAVFAPVLEEDDPMFLPTLARYGRVNEELFTRQLEYSGLVPSTRYESLINVVPAGWTGRVPLMGGLPPNPRYLPHLRSRYSWHSPLSMTNIGLEEYPAPYRGSASSDKELGIPEWPQYDESYIDTVLVVSGEENVTDLCLYWAVRQQHPHSPPFPLWIPLSQLETSDGIAGLRTAYASTDKRSLGPLRGLYVISGSVTIEQITSALKNSELSIKVHTSDLFRFFSLDYHIGFRQESELHFSRGRARFHVPQVAVAGRAAFNDSLAIETEIPEYPIPQGRSFEMRITGSVDRMSARSIVTSLSPELIDQLRDFRLPSRWTALLRSLSLAGYGCAPSDKGRLS
jgi:hypothetical protein